MSVALSDLLTPLTRSAVVPRVLDVLAKAAFPVTSWASTALPRALIESFSEVAVDVSNTIASIARMVTLETAEGDGLTLHARDAYDEERKPASVTKGTRTLVESAGAPQMWSAGDLVIVCSADPSLVFRNVDPVTLPALGSIAVTFAAETPGAKYNVDAGTLGSLATPMPGVTIAPTTGTGWITQTGTDEETDESLKTRCKSKWATLASTGSYNAYVKYALDASPEITKVRIQEDPFAVAPYPAVTVIVAGPAGAPTGAALAAANIEVQRRRPLGVNVVTIGATPYAVSLGGTVRVKTAFRAQAEAQINSDLRAYFAALGIGEAVYVSQLIEIIMAAPGVVNVTLTKPDTTPMVPGTDDVLPAGDGVATLINSLTYTNV